ncbi:MAG TPA: RcnB family protein [Sphingobium sp.]
MHRWGSRVDGRWRAGRDAPGGWAAYRRPVRGFALPRYWVQPGFYIANYGAYGLPAPGYGYGWSRYYDDAVLTDQYGSVYDSRSDIQWERYEGGYDADAPGERAVVAAAPHTAPSESPPPGLRQPMPYDDSVTSSNEYPGPAEYHGQWRGTWRGDDGRIYSGTYEGVYNGTADVGPPQPQGGPHWMGGPANGYPPGATVYYAAPGTTVIIQPGTTTTITYEEENVVPVHHRAWMRHGKTVRCGC